MIKNSIGRFVPEGYRPYSGPWQPIVPVRRHGGKVRQWAHRSGKVIPSIANALRNAGIRDGMTISFHHHFRDGDYVLNNVMDEIAAMGIKGLTLASSSLSKVNEVIVRHIEDGVVTKIETSGMRGKLAEAVSGGALQEPVIIRSHGGRARAIEAGEVKIDIAILGVPSSDCMGNASGKGKHTLCGSLGYAMVDAKYADHVILVTDDLCEYPNRPASITQEWVDAIVVMDAIGDPEGIASGATRFTRNPKELMIAEYAAQVISATDRFKDGFSFQTGSGGSSLAMTRFLRAEMERRQIRAGFALGGITQPMVELHEAGMISRLFDTQTFDLPSANSLFKNPGHIEIDASQYANPASGGCLAAGLDFVVLSALEIDTDFNVNVMTGSDGVMRGASGGHSDTAASAAISIIVAPLMRGRMPTVVDSVNTVITPGETVDVLVTERGIAVNPRRQDVKAMLMDAKLPVLAIDELKEKAYRLTGAPQPIPYEERVVGLVEYRDGTIIDAVRQVKND